MPVAILLLAIFVAGELYNAYCKSNGELDIQLVTTTVFKFVIPFTIITRSYDLIYLFFNFFNDIVRKLSLEMTLQNATDLPSNIDQLMEMVRQMNFFEQLNYMSQLLFMFLGIKIIGVFIFVICYGRLFEIMLYWLVAPLPLATLVHSEHKQIGQNYLKLVLALALQAVIIFICLLIYGELIKSATWHNENLMSANYTLLGYTVLLAFTLVKSGQFSKRLLGTF